MNPPRSTHQTYLPTDHAVPRRGYVLSTAVERIAGPLRKAARALEQVIVRDGQVDELWLDLPWACKNSVERTAWGILASWLVWIARGKVLRGSDLSDGASWFAGRDSRSVNECFWTNANACTRPHLSEIEHQEGLADLLPYVIDVHGPGTRLSVRRDAATQTARTQKKTKGVFYTPADVAIFMAKTVLADFRRGEPPTVLDPAVGTGVFLRAALNELKRRYAAVSAFDIARHCLFGIDIDELALDGAAYVLLHDVLPIAMGTGLTPSAAWLILRANLIQCDALTVDCANAANRDTLRPNLEQLLPAIADGADIVLGNPPYADLGSRRDVSQLAVRFTTVAAEPRESANLYPVFVEQMVRLGKFGGSGAMVVPLSLACNSGPQFRACRVFIQAQPGTWRFAFFDREPHALFGEDVKTRNTVIFWHSEVEGRGRIYTGPLRKWRGDTRRTLLSTIGYIHVNESIVDGIPKLNGEIQATAWSALHNERVTLETLLIGSGRSTLRELPRGRATEVFVGPTAYNFLNVARPVILSVGPHEELSSNPLHRLAAANVNDAACIYALLISNFAFWWWHVNGDGFHVNFNTLAELPVGAAVLTKLLQQRLAELGDRVWHEVRRKPSLSANRGKVSFSFPSNEQRQLRGEIDALLIESLGLRVEFANSLVEFVDAVIDARLFETGNLKNKENVHGPSYHT